MASITNINNGEKGKPVRDKLNEVITEANKVDNKIDKVASATPGNYAIFKSGGDIEEATTTPNGILFAAAGTTVCPSYTDNGDGSVTIGTGKYVLNQFDRDVDENLREYEVAGNTFVLTDNSTNYIVANYNNGTPVLQVTLDVNIIDESKIIPVFTIVRTGTVLHEIDWDTLGILLANKLHASIVKTQRFRRQSGFALSEYGTRNVRVTAGTMWIGANEVEVEQVDSNVDNIRFYAHVGGVYTLSLITQYNNTQYDNGTNLVTLTANKYAVNFIYRGVENNKHIYMFLGGGDYDLGQAEAAQPPADIPSVVSSHAVLVGKIIVLKNAATATEILSAFDVAFNQSPVTIHNNLSDIQGGAGDEYYHLTQAQHTQTTILDKLDATAPPTINDDSLDGYSIGSNWIDVNNGGIYVCENNTAGAAVWIQTNYFEKQIACSDLTSDLTTGTTKAYFRMPTKIKLTEVRASVLTAPTGASLIVDVDKDGVSVLSTKLSIDATETTSTTAATPAVISDSALNDDDEITIDIDQVGSSVAGAGLIVTLIGNKL